MEKCSAEYSVGDFADLDCILEKGHVSNLHDTGTILWSNYCEHVLVSNRSDGKYRYCSKCYTSEDNL